MTKIGRLLQAGDYWFEDLAEGDHYRTAEVAITEAQIDAFAELSGDFFAIHMDDEFARSQGFPRRIAHGLLGLALTDGLKNQSPVRIMAIASLGWSWKFCAPILAGDLISAAVSVVGARLSSKGQGLVTLAISVTNQDGVVVQDGETTLLVRLRPIS
jgi:3-hydroxybutyryl-CoA dehydratase